MADKKLNFQLTATDKTAAAFASARRNIDGIGSAATGMSRALGAALPALGGLGLVSFAKQGIDAADALNDLSQRTGVAVKTLADYKLAATQADTSIESLAAGIQRMSLSIGQAEAGSKAQAQALQALGVTARDPQLAFEQLADAVASSNDPIKTNADLQKVLGKNYAELLPLLQGGSQALRESAAASKTFSEAMVELAPAAAQFNDQLDILKNTAAGAAASVLSKLVPSLNEYIAVGKEVVENGTLLDKVRFFGLGNASDEIVDRVRKNLAESAASMDRLRKAAAASNAGGTIRTAATLRGVAKQANPAKTFDQDALYADEMAQAWQQADAELKNYLDDLAFMADVDMAQMSGVNEITRQWEEAGRALTDEMMTPLERANLEFGRLDELLDRGVITWETYTRAVLQTQDAIEQTPEKLEEMDSFAKKAAENIQDSFADFLFDPFDQGLSGMLEGFGKTIQRMIADAVAADLAKKLFGDIAGGSGSGVAGGLLTGIGAIFGFADGGVASHGRPLALPRFAGGGVADSMSIFGEAGPEAAVPLPDGRHIPVKMMGGGGHTVNVYVSGNNNAPDVRRAAAHGAREALGMFEGARRYA